MVAFALSGKTVVLTGAASGIGAELADRLAAKKAVLALVDQDHAGLAAVAAKARRHGADISEHVLDLGDPAAILSLPAAVQAAHDAPSVLINNAGVALIGGFEQASLHDFAWLMNINFWGAVRLTHAFLPALRTQPAARIVLLSSVFGLIAPPGQTAYAASKFALRGFGEALRHELAGTSIGVTLVHPGGVDTNIARNARIGAAIDPATARASAAEFQKMLVTPPGLAAEKIVNGIEQRRGRVLIGSDATRIDLIQRCFPVRYWKLIERAIAKPRGS